MTAHSERAVLLDIEGTVAPMAYVRTVMFPYARRHYRRWLAELSPPRFQNIRARFEAELTVHIVDGDTLAETLEDLTDRDVKSAALKDVQQQIWHDGFQSGVLRGQLFPEVENVLKTWRAHDIAIFIYSSAAAGTQRDWFGSCASGDLTPLIDGYFDINSAGSKIRPESYSRIATLTGIRPRLLLFCSDVGAELDAATQAGIHAVHVARGVDAHWGDRESVHNLADIDISSLADDFERSVPT